MDFSCTSFPVVAKCFFFFHVVFKFSFCREADDAEQSKSWPLKNILLVFVTVKRRQHFKETYS